MKDEDLKEKGTRLKYNGLFTCVSKVGRPCSLFSCQSQCAPNICYQCTLYNTTVHLLSRFVFTSFALYIFSSCLCTSNHYYKRPFIPGYAVYPHLTLSHCIILFFSPPSLSLDVIFTNFCINSIFILIFCKF